MKCFIHTNKEAIAACRKCGKGMCEECSSYSGHSGICPECRKEELIQERNQKQYLAQEERSARGWSIFWLVLTFWTIIGLIWNVVRIFQHNNEIEKLDSRVAVLNKEIKRLEDARTSKKGQAFI